MTSDTDDLEEQLRQNLELRRDLVAEVAKAREGMASDTDDLEQLRQELKQRVERRARWDMRAILNKFGRL
jgi:K+/H+ antiporter YhaU regulatory subunit KhtT